MRSRVEKAIARWQACLERAYDELNYRSHGLLGVLRDAIIGFNQNRSAEVAASMAYYIFFSLFPLALVLVAVGGFLLRMPAAYQTAIDAITDAIPVSPSLIERNVLQVLALRGPIGLIGLAGMMWSVSGTLMALTHSINRAWPHAQARNFWQGRLLGLGMLAIIILLLVLYLASTALLGVLPQLGLPSAAITSLYGSAFWRLVSTVVRWLFAFFMFFGLYKWVPNTRVRVREAGAGALFAALAWEIATKAFAWYVGSGLARYELVYGSLATVVALLFWIYISNWITLFGAHLSAAVARYSCPTRRSRNGA